MRQYIQEVGVDSLRGNIPGYQVQLLLPRLIPGTQVSRESRMSRNSDRHCTGVTDHCTGVTDVKRH